MSNRPGLTLVTPVLSDGPAFVPVLERALAMARPDCILARVPPLDRADGKRLVGALVPIVQASGAALLVTGDPAVAVRTGADGAHVVARGDLLAAQIAGAIDTLKPDRIVGTGGFVSRHDAMEAAERDIDYVMFGGPGAEELDADAVCDRIAWWAEIFNVPCVGFADSLDTADRLIEAGADFIALASSLWAHDQSEETLRAIAARLALGRVPV